MKSSKRIEAIASQLIANGRELVGSGAVITTVGNQLLEQGETLLAQTTKITGVGTDTANQKKGKQKSQTTASSTESSGRGLAPVPVNDVPEFSKELKKALNADGIEFTSDLRAASKTKLRKDYAEIKDGLSQLASFLNYPSLTSEGKRGRKAGSKNKTTAKSNTTTQSSGKRGRKEVKLTDMGIFSKALKKKFEEEGITTAQELRSTPKSELRTKFSSVKNGLQQLADYLNYPSLTGSGQRGRKPSTAKATSSNRHSIKELGVANNMFKKLESAGFKFAEDIASAEVGELTNIKGIGEKRANQLMEEAQRIAS